MGYQKYWFDKWRAKGVCYLCRHDLRPGEEGRSAHLACVRMNVKLPVALIREKVKADSSILGEPVRDGRTRGPLAELQKRGFSHKKGCGFDTNEKVQAQIEWEKELVRQAEQRYKTESAAPEAPTPRVLKTRIIRGQEFEVVFDGT